MRNAMTAAKKANRFAGTDDLDETTLRIDNRRLRGPDSLQGCIVNKPNERPSDIIRRVNSEQLYWDEKKDNIEAISIIKKHLVTFKSCGK